MYCKGVGRGGGAQAPTNLWVKRKKGRKKHPTNKNGFPSRTHPTEAPPLLKLVYALVWCMFITFRQLAIIRRGDISDVMAI